jgi:hypothetical protein
MQNETWLKQTQDEPLFPNLIWSRPESKAQSGKLLIIGGNAQGVSSVAKAFQVAEKTGAGTVRAILPDALEKTFGKAIAAGYFTPSTPSGSFAKSSLGEFLNESLWSDCVLLTGELGRNSETAILLESYVSKYSGLLVMARDAVDYFLNSDQILNRPNTLLVLNFAQLQKLGSNTQLEKAFTFNMDFLRLVELMKEFSSLIESGIVLKHLDNMFVAYKGTVVSHKLKEELPTWRVETSAKASVWWMQNPSKLIEAVSCSLLG